MIDYYFYQGENISAKQIDDINYLLTLLTTKHITVTLFWLIEILETSKLLLSREKETDRIVGMATMVILKMPTGSVGRIEDVVVHDKFRRMGIGKTLILKLIDESRRIGLQGVALTSNPKRIEANQMYKKLGFKKIETNVYKLEF